MFCNKPAQPVGVGKLKVRETLNSRRTFNSDSTVCLLRKPFSLSSVFITADGLCDSLTSSDAFIRTLFEVGGFFFLRKTSHCADTVPFRTKRLNNRSASHHLLPWVN